MWITRIELEMLKSRISNLEVKMNNIEEETRIVLPGYIYGGASLISGRQFAYALMRYLNIDILQVSRRGTIEIVKKPSK